MAKGSDHLAGFETENTGGGLLSGFLAEEDEFDRRSLWRLGSWGVASVSAVIVALLADQSSMGLRRDQVAAGDLARQSQQMQLVAKEGQNETRRLVSAIDTLNGDRDRLYSRVTVLEQGLDSVTGTIARQNSAPASPQAVSTPPATTSSAPSEPIPAAQNPSPPPAVSPVATTAKTAEKPNTNTNTNATTPESGPAAVFAVGQAASTSPAATPATSLMASKSMMASPDFAAAKPIEPEKPASAVTAATMPEVVASISPAINAESDTVQATTPKLVQRTEFGVDVGGANSIGGLRALWHGLLKSRANAPLAALQPIIVVKESRTGLGMQLRLVAGPLSDAAAAAKICATMIESERTCETAVFDGQRLAMKPDEPPASTAVKPAVHRRSVAKRVTNDEPPQKPESSTLLSLFGR